MEYKLSYFFLVFLIKSVLNLNNSTIKVGEQYINEIEPHEIYMHQFNSSSRIVSFSLYAYTGDPLLYGTFTLDYTKFQVNEQEISKFYVPRNYFITSKSYQKYSNLIIAPPFFNDNSIVQQYIVLVYCPNEIKCKYSITLLENDNTIIFLRENLPIALYNRKTIPLNPETFETFQFTVNEPSSLGKIKVSFYYMIYSGNMNFEVLIDDKPISPIQQITGQKGKIFFECDQNSQVSIFSKPIEPSYYIAYYLLNEKSDIEQEVNIGTTEMDQIQFNQIKTWGVSKDLFQENTKLLVHIKTENCAIRLFGLDETITTLQTEQSFYQIIFETPNDYKFKIELIHFDDLDNKNLKDYCIYYVYSIRNVNTNSIIVPESTTLTTRMITEIHQIIIYEFPFLYHSETNCLIIDINLKNKGLIFLTIIFDNKHYYSMKFSLPASSSIFIMPETFEDSCAKKELCNVKVEIIGGNIEIDCKFTAKEKAPQYIPLNTVIVDKTLGIFTRYYYTYVKHGDKGIINLTYKNNGLSLYYLIIDKNSEINKNIIFEDNWSTQMNYYTGEISYTVDNECANGCILLIKLVSTCKDTINSNSLLLKYCLFVSSNNKSIQAPVNEKIKGFFDENFQKLSFLFTVPLSHYLKFQVFIKGENTKYEIKDLNESNPCCEGINQEYIPGKESKFIDFEIKQPFNSSQIQIEIIASLNGQFDPLLSNYEIIVNPYLYFHFPIYNIKDILENEYYTSKNNNTIFLMYERDIQEVYDIVKVYAENPQLETPNLEIFSHTKKLEEYAFNTLFYYFDNFFEKKAFTIKSGYGNNVLNFPIKQAEHAAAFISVEGEKNDSKINVFLRKNLFFNSINLIPKDKNFQYFPKDSKITVNLLEKLEPTMTIDYSYYLEIEVIEGYGKILLEKTYFLEGKRVFKIEYSFLQKQTYIEILTFSENLSVKMRFYIKKKENFQMESFDFRNITHLEYYNKPFPLYLYCHISNMSNQILNFRLLYNIIDEQLFYNYSNLELKAFSTNEESISLFESMNYTLKDKQELNILSINERQISLISKDNINTNNNNLDYIMLQITEKNKQYPLQNNQLSFQLFSSNQINNENLLTLIPKKYVYSKISKSTKKNVYILDSEFKNENYKQIQIEFASCSEAIYDFKFENYQNEKVLHYDRELEKFGKTIIKIKSTELERYIKMTITLISDTDENEIYHLIKYSVIDQTQEFNEFSINKQITYIYHPYNTTIQSYWGNITNITNYNSVVKSVYYYYLFENSDKSKPFLSICAMKNAEFSTKTTNSSKNYTNEKISKKGYQNQIIGYFMDENEEEFLFSFELININIYSGHTIIWIIVIICVLGLFIGFGTYWVYKEVSKREKEEEIILSVEM